MSEAQEGCAWSPTNWKHYQWTNPYFVLHQGLDVGRRWENWKPSLSFSTSCVWRPALSCFDVGPSNYKTPVSNRLQQLSIYNEGLGVSVFLTWSFHNLVTHNTFWVILWSVLSKQLEIEFLCLAQLAIDEPKLPWTTFQWFTESKNSFFTSWGYVSMWIV